MIEFWKIVLSEFLHHKAKLLTKFLSIDSVVRPGDDENQSGRVIYRYLFVI